MPTTEAPLPFGEMLSALDTAAPRSNRRVEFVDPALRFALGTSSLGVFSQRTDPAFYRAGELVCVLDGELYDTDTRAAKLVAAGHRVDPEGHAALLLSLVAINGIESLAEINGSFAAAIVDTRAQQLTLVSDAFGTRPLYYAQLRDRVTFASRIAAVLVDEDVSRDFDWQGLSQFFTFGHYFNEQTSLRDVRILPAGSVFQFEASTNTGKVIQYWSSCHKTREVYANRREAYEAVDEALLAAVRRRSDADQWSLGLSLSGGLDARTILGVVEQPKRLTTVCLGMAGSRDHAASSQLAALVGCDHHSHLLDQEFLGDFRRHLQNMVALTDGQYLSQCIVMPTLSLYQRLGIDVLLRGHGGELLHMSKAYNYSLDAEAFSLQGEQALQEWLWKRLQAYLLDGVEGRLFADAAVDRECLARESLQLAIGKTPGGAAASQRIAHLFLQQRLTRETPLSLMKFRSVVEPRMPYADQELVEVLLAIPPEWKMEDELQTFILRKRQPTFCQVENTNNGSTLGAGKFSRAIASVRTKFGSKLGLPGYQPYERLGLWLRRELAPLVRETLLDDTCLDGSVFAPDTVRQVVDGHLTGARNHTYLIMAMMVFETGRRRLIGDRSSGSHVDARQPLAI